MRRAARTDANHSHIVGALIRCGCEVQSLAMVGDGCADLLVHHKATKRVLLIECKDGSKPPSARKLTPDQEEWHKRFPVIVVNSADEAIAALATIPENVRSLDASREIA